MYASPVDEPSKAIKAGACMVFRGENAGSRMDIRYYSRKPLRISNL